ncbi:hypothetical protein SsS58_05453 [Streptomyces scabiei]|uniref:Uncharacterized protein n=1 Tax=Streptomyces scabiei TaxID=1930 RepID=A0A124C4P2_STRSC|nr:hypothetical protein SsS58_05453 [Streptomyces scabiei]
MPGVVGVSGVVGRRPVSRPTGRPGTPTVDEDCRSPAAPMVCRARLTAIEEPASCPGPHPRLRPGGRLRRQATSAACPARLPRGDRRAAAKTARTNLVRGRRPPPYSTTPHREGRASRLISTRRVARALLEAGVHRFGEWQPATCPAFTTPSPHGTQRPGQTRRRNSPRRRSREIPGGTRRPMSRPGPGIGRQRARKRTPAPTHTQQPAISGRGTPLVRARSPMTAAGRTDRAPSCPGAAVAEPAPCRITAVTL